MILELPPRPPSGPPGPRARDRLVPGGRGRIPRSVGWPREPASQCGVPAAAAAGQRPGGEPSPGLHAGAAGAALDGRSAGAGPAVEARWRGRAGGRQRQGGRPQYARRFERLGVPIEARGVLLSRGGRASCWSSRRRWRSWRSSRGCSTRWVGEIAAGTLSARAAAEVAAGQSRRRVLTPCRLPDDFVKVGKMPKIGESLRCEDPPVGVRRAGRPRRGGRHREGGGAEGPAGCRSPGRRNPASRADSEGPGHDGPRLRRSAPRGVLAAFEGRVEASARHARLSPVVRGRPDSSARSSGTRSRRGERRYSCSAASVWEMAIKQALGRLEVPEPPSVAAPASASCRSRLPSRTRRRRPAPATPSRPVRPLARRAGADGRDDLVTHDPLIRAYPGVAFLPA